MTITYVESDLYRSTNNIYSLWLARKYLVDDLLLVLRPKSSDVFYGNL